MIRKLWNEFDNLYTALKNKYTDPTEFHAAKAVKHGLNIFLFLQLEILKMLVLLEAFTDLLTLHHTCMY
jgi:hypothetical protein